MKIKKFINAFSQLYKMNKDFLKQKYVGFKREIKGEDKKKKKINHNVIRMFYDNYDPVFVLTTGRTGSRFITEVVNKSNNLDAYHEAYPDLKLMSDFAYNNYDKKFLKHIIASNRSELILNSYLNNNYFLESNQCLTFFAYALNDLFPNSKFIHLIREPESFVLSAYKLGWYEEETLWEYGRLKADFYKKNESIKNLYNLWNYTNKFIFNFSKNIDNDRFMIVKSEDLFDDPKIIINILEFIDKKNIDIGEEEILKIQKRPVNKKHNEKKEITLYEKNKIIKLKNKYLDEYIYSSIYN